MTEETYELPTPGAEPGIESTLGQLGQNDVAGPGPRTTTDAAPPAVPEGLTEDAGKLLQALAEYVRDDFIRVLASRDQNIERMLDERLTVLHDPHAVMTKGIIFGAAGVLLALVTMVVIGLLFLHGLSLVAPPR